MRDDGTIDLDAFAGHAGAVAGASGIRGFLVNGHAGEGHLLTADEKSGLIATARQVVRPDHHISAGISAESTDAACREAEAAAAAGADSVLVFQPAHWSRGVADESVVAHHGAVAAAAGLPVVLYRAPVSWGPLSYSPELVLRLVDIDGVAGIKEGSWDVAAYEEVWRAVKARAPRVSVMASGDEHLLACFQIGTDGSQVSLAALFPDLVCDLFDAARRADWATARHLHEQVYPLARAIYRTPPACMATARLKAGLRLLGRLASDRMRRPGRELTGAELAVLGAALTPA